MKSTSITVRLNNGEIKQGIEALQAFSLAVLNGLNQHQNVIADALLKTYTTKQEGLRK
jgi:hypothetical protein